MTFGLERAINSGLLKTERHISAGSRCAKKTNKSIRSGFKVAHSSLACRPGTSVPVFKISFSVDVDGVD